MFEQCPPAEFTPPLSTEFSSVADRFLPALSVAFRSAFGHDLLLWQKDILRCVTELDPVTGRLRWRQYLVLVPRQQGKTELVAALAILWMLWHARDQIISVASNAEQARILFGRVLDVIRGTPALGRRFRKATDTRGIESNTGGKYDVRAAKGSVLQGIPIGLGVVDEVHISRMELWNALVNGTGGRDDTLVLGISTAGDDSSELLHHLIEEGQAGRIGLAWWRAPDANVPADDAELGRYLMAAGPSLAAGLVPLANAIEDARTLPEPDLIRYKFNWHTAAINVFVPVSTWLLGRRDEPQPKPSSGIVLAVDRAPDWSYGSITASWRLPDGVVWTELVQSIVKPDPATLVESVALLVSRTPGVRAVVVDGYSLKAVGAELKLRGLNVVPASLADNAAAASRFYALTARGRVWHPGDPLLSMQLPAVRRKNVTGSESFRVTRAPGALSIDAVVATVLGVYFAETLPEVGPQLFV